MMQSQITSLTHHTPNTASTFSFKDIILIFSPLCLCSSEVFCDSDKNLLKENDIIRFPKLADTYKKIAEEGPDVFYNGSMAQNIVDDIQAAGHFILSLLTFFYHALKVRLPNKNKKMQINVSLQEGL